MEAPSRPTHIGILGIGQMGASAAVFFSRAGYRVTVWARNPKRLADVPAMVDRMNRFLDQHGSPATALPGEIDVTTDLDTINEQSDLILECIAEDLSQKSELLRQLSPAAQRGAVLASCTSGLSISALGQRSGVGKRLVGAHFWNPPHLMPVVEVIRGDQTDDGLVEFVCDLLRSADKLPVVCRDIPGFIGNRLMHALWREALHLVQQGFCSVEDVDRVARLTFGLRLPAVGPFENMDLVGMELVEQIHSYLFKDLSDAKMPSSIVKERLALGQHGIRTGQGFYDWSRRDPNTLIERRDRQIVQQLKFLAGEGLLRPADDTPGE